MHFLSSMRKVISSIFSEKKEEKISKKNLESSLSTSKPLCRTRLRPSATALIEERKPFVIEGSSPDVPLDEGHIYVVRNATWRDDFKAWLITDVQDITNGFFVCPNLFINDDGSILMTVGYNPPSIFLANDPALKYEKGKQLELFRR